MVIAGSGIGALEAVLMLRELLGSAAQITIVSPATEYVDRPLAILEPFGLGTPRRIPLADLARDLGFRHRQERVARIDDDARIAVTDSGAELSYDALLLAIGAAPVVAVPGAITYGGPASNRELEALLERIRGGEVHRVAFAVPTEVPWSLPLYELALLTARTVGAQAELVFVTPEPEPLPLFGARASEGIEQVLALSGVELHPRVAPIYFEDGLLHAEGGETIAADAVLALPRREVGEIPGVPQGENGFIATDNTMRAEGTQRVWVAGDASWFPIKQGGLAAQQADAAAAAIARLADPSIEARPFRPVLRAAMLTGDAPRYLRAAVDDPEGGEMSVATPLWWPPGKVAGRLLAAYLDRRDGGIPQPEAYDLDPSASGRASAEEHEEAVKLALAAADADARWGDIKGALRWLDVAERLDLALPESYARKRQEWSRELSVG